MKTKLIKTEGYLWLVDLEAEIKENDYFYSPALQEVLFASRDMLSWNFDKSQEQKGWLKCLAYFPLQSDSKVLDLPLLPNPWRERIDPDDIVEELDNKLVRYSTEESDLWNAWQIGVKDGYKTAQLKGSYSLEDMERAIDMSRKANSDQGVIDLDAIYPYSDDFTNINTVYTRYEIIKSLSSPILPKDFILSNSGNSIVVGHNGLNNEFGTLIYSVTFNENGKSVIEGEYVY